MNRFKDAVRNNPVTIQLIDDLKTWFEQWSAGVSSNPPTFVDAIVNPEIRRLTLDHLRHDIERLQEIGRRETESLKSKATGVSRPRLSPEQRKQALIDRLEALYDPPGRLRIDGPRHGNDFEDIRDVQILPTQSELLCPINPHLPAFFPGARHHKPENSMERHLDIQFRLLREELM